MSNELMPYVEGGGLTRQSRRSARAISHSRAVAQVRMARVDDEADIAIQKLEATTFATGSAMHAVARVHMILKATEEQAPDLSGRLNRLADYHEIAVVQTVEDLRRDLRRR